jgi:hypothetical protein
MSSCATNIRMFEVVKGRHLIETAVLKVLTDIWYAVNSAGNPALLTLINLSTASDTVDLIKLLLRLQVWDCAKLVRMNILAGRS